MEQHLITRLTGNLMGCYFQSKRDMAEKIGVSYRSLLSAINGESSEQSAENVVGSILRYCIREHIPLDNVFPPKET